MDIYHDAGVDALVDLDKARHELKASAAVNHEGTRRAIVAEITAAALLDIAYSLRPIGAEAAEALRYASRLDDSPEGEADVDDETRDFFVVGDLVHLRNDTEPGEIVKLLFTEDELAADVDFASGYAQRHYVRDLVRIIDRPESAELAETIVESIGDGAASGDELDDDFAGIEEHGVPLDEIDKSADFSTGIDAGHAGLDALDEKPAKKKKGGK